MDFLVPYAKGKYSYLFVGTMLVLIGVAVLLGRGVDSSAAAEFSMVGYGSLGAGAVLFPHSPGQEGVVPPNPIRWKRPLI